MNINHTPGPWVARIDNYGIDKLIAAAPELLEALQDILSVAKTFELLPKKWIEPLSKAELAIQKATI